MDIHTVIYPKPRCPVCSLPTPCMKCGFVKLRQELIVFVDEHRKRIKNVYKNKLMPEIQELSEPKIRACGRNLEQAEKINERVRSIQKTIDQVLPKLEQIAVWLKNGEKYGETTCTDATEYASKRKWLVGYLEAAYYGADRVLFEWRPKAVGGPPFEALTIPSYA
jgi:hypothetical protein